MGDKSNDGQTGMYFKAIAKCYLFHSAHTLGRTLRKEVIAKVDLQRL